MPDVIVDPIAVPNVVTLSEADAVTSILNAYLIQSVIYDYSDTVEAGVVISQSPAPATEVDANSTVTITVSLGTVGNAGFGHILHKHKRRSRKRRKKLR